MPYGRLQLLKHRKTKVADVGQGSEMQPRRSYCVQLNSGPPESELAFPYLFSQSWKFGVLPFAVSAQCRSKASASHAIRSTTAGHSQGNSPPVSPRYSLPKIFIRSHHLPS